MKLSKTIERIIKRSAEKLNYHYVDYDYLFNLLGRDFTCQEYELFFLQKKSGGQRQISAPRSELNKIQQFLKLYLCETFVPCTAANGFVNGKSIVTNAQLHIEKNYVFNIDIKNFFGTISSMDVKNALMQEPFCLPDEDAEVFAFLCTYSFPERNEDGDFVIKNELPQGAPTSPILSNIVFASLDDKLIEVSKQFKIAYSRYADDITFSSNLNKFEDDGNFRKKLNQIFSESKFTLNSKKTRLQGYWQQQVVTGLVVNDGVNVKRKLIREMRTILFIWEKYGLDEAMRSYYKHHKHDLRHYAEPYFTRVILGKLMFMRMVRGETDKLVNEFIDKFNDLNTTSGEGKLVFENKKYVHEQEFILANDAYYFVPNHSQITTK